MFRVAHANALRKFRLPTILHRSPAKPSAAFIRTYVQICQFLQRRTRTTFEYQFAGNTFLTIFWSLELISHRSCVSIPVPTRIYQIYSSLVNLYFDGFVQLAKITVNIQGDLDETEILKVCRNFKYINSGGLWHRLKKNII